jgi:hypothetical protein
VWKREVISNIDSASCGLECGASTQGAEYVVSLWWRAKKIWLYTGDTTRVSRVCGWAETYLLRREVGESGQEGGGLTDLCMSVGADENRGGVAA